MSAEAKKHLEEFKQSKEPGGIVEIKDAPGIVAMNKYVLIELMESYHNSQLKEKIPSEEEIRDFSETKFMLGDDELPYTLAERYCLIKGVGWLKSKLLEQ